MISLRGLRLRLTAWYAGSFAALLIVLGVGIFVRLSRDRSAELDRSLEEAVGQAFRAARVNVADGHDLTSALLLAMGEVQSPERGLYLFGPDGTPVLGSESPPREVAGAAKRALTAGAARGRFETSGGQLWRVYAERSSMPEAPAHALVAVADVAALERQDARLLEVLVGSGLLALIPIAVGGYFLARMSAAPVTERLRRFTAEAAHELRNPVAVVRGHVEVALEKPREPGEYAAVLERVARETERLSGIVDDLFFLARADAGERTASRELVYLDDLAADAVQAAGVLARSRSVRLTLGSYDESVVRGDPELLRRLLMILLDNAIKFTPPKMGVRLDVEMRGRSPTVVVEDEGIGIAAEDLPRLFERFFRGNAARGRSQGSGLGLAIARHIADLHDARITVTSAPGRGTRFAVTFPSAT